MSRRNRLPNLMTLTQAAAVLGYADVTMEKLIRSHGMLRRDDIGRIVVTKDDLSFLVGTIEARSKKKLPVKIV